MEQKFKVGDYVKYGVRDGKGYSALAKIVCKDDEIFSGWQTWRISFVTDANDVSYPTSETYITKLSDDEAMIWMLEL
jgi:hypothetical protein